MDSIQSYMQEIESLKQSLSPNEKQYRMQLVVQPIEQQPNEKLRTVSASEQQN